MQLLRTTIQHLQLTKEISKIFTFLLSFHREKAFKIDYTTLTMVFVHSVYSRDMKLKHLIFGPFLNNATH